MPDLSPELVGNLRTARLEAAGEAVKTPEEQLSREDFGCSLGNILDLQLECGDQISHKRVAEHLRNYEDGRFRFAFGEFISPTWLGEEQMMTRITLGGVAIARRSRAHPVRRRFVLEPTFVGIRAHFSKLPDGGTRTHHSLGFYSAELRSLLSETKDPTGLFVCEKDIIREVPPRLDDPDLQNFTRIFRELKTASYPDSYPDTYRLMVDV